MGYLARISKFLTDDVRKMTSLVDTVNLKERRWYMVYGIWCLSSSVRGGGGVLCEMLVGGVPPGH